MANFKQARWYTSSSIQRGISLIVVHCPQYPENNQAAERLAAYFATTTRKASTHAVCDNDSLWECVHDGDVAWGASGANRHGLHIEIAGYAEQSAAEWADPFSEAAIKIAAKWCREKAVLYAVPVVFLDAAALQAGRAGFTTHREVEKAFPSTGHVDPGPNFPIAHFLDLVRGMTPPPPIHELPPPVAGPDVPENLMKPYAIAISTDAQGRGYRDLNVPSRKVVSIVANDDDPGDGWGPHPPVCSRLGVGNQTRVVVHDTIPNGRVDVTVWVAD